MTAVTKADAEPTLPARLGYTIKEVALVLGSNYWTIHRAVKAGDIPSFRLGGEYRISLFALADLIGVPAASVERFLADIRASDADSDVA